MSYAIVPPGMYRPSAKAPRGPWGRFLDRMRRERGWNQTQAFEALREGLHLGPKSRASYIALEEGRLPDAEQQRFLARYFGQTPDDEPAETEAEPSLAAAINALTAELRASREAREADSIRLQAVEAAVALLAQRGGVELPEPVARQG